MTQREEGVAFLAQLQTESEMQGLCATFGTIVYLVCKWLVRQDVLTVSYAVGILFCIRDALCIWALQCGSSDCGALHYLAVELDPQNCKAGG